MKAKDQTYNAPSFRSKNAYDVFNNTNQILTPNHGNSNKNISSSKRIQTQNDDLKKSSSKNKKILN